MTITTSRTFKSGNSEAVRLPRDIAFCADVERTALAAAEDTRDRAVFAALRVPRGRLRDTDIEIVLLH